MFSGVRGARCNYTAIVHSSIPRPLLLCFLLCFFLSNMPSSMTLTPNSYLLGHRYPPQDPASRTIPLYLRGSLAATKSSAVVHPTWL